MKTKLTLITLIVLTSIVSYAQDMLILKSGEDINAKIVEISSQEVKYKKFENLEGPTYTISKGDIFMIKYQNGTKETFDNNTENTASKSVLESPPVQQQKTFSYSDSQYKLKKGKVLTGIGAGFTTVGTALLISGGVVFGNSFYNYSPYDGIAETNGIIMMSVGAAAFSAGLPMMITGLVKMGSAKKEIRMSKNSTASMMISPSIISANYTKSGTAPGLYFGLTF